MDHYKARESTRQQGKVVYDVDKDSPFYKNAKDFIDPKQQIRVDETTAMASKKHGARPTKNRYFKELKPWYKAEAAYDSTLVFESRFESGNLKQAIQVGEFEYELVMKPDYNTRNFTQWFYFKVGNTRQYQEYVFHIINFVKDQSLYNDGMMPLFYSE